MKHLPNALTLLRLVLAPLVAWFFWQGAVAPEIPAASKGGNGDPQLLFLQSIATNLTLAAVVFVLAALTDLFDGMAARAFNAHSKFGRLIDPIADKAIVGLPLIVIAIAMARSGYPLWPVVAIATLVIVSRDITMTLIRLNATDGEGARVSALAKIKTALELLVVGSLLTITALGAHLQAQAYVDDPSETFLLPFGQAFEWLWLIGLVVTAALSAWTALQYLKPKAAA